MDKIFIAYNNNEYSIIRGVINDDGVVTYKKLKSGIKSQFEAEVKLKEYLKKVVYQ